MYEMKALHIAKMEASGLSSGQKFNNLATKQKHALQRNESSGGRIAINCKCSSYAGNGTFFPVPDMIESISTRGTPALAFSSPTSTALANRA